MKYKKKTFSSKLEPRSKNKLKAVIFT